MAKEYFQIYPRGFFGALLEEVPDIRENRQSQIVNSKQYDSNMFQVKAPKQESNAEVDKLYRAYLANPLSVNNCEFFGKLISVALKAFGTRSLTAWVNVQRSSPYFTERHKDFLEDTGRYIFNTSISGGRRLAPELWEPLISSSLSSTGVSVVEKVSPIEIFDRNIMVSEAIQIWCQHQGGVYDMLRCLRIFFGEK